MNLARRTRITRGSKQRTEYWSRAGYARTMALRHESSDGMPGGGWAIFALEYGRRKPAYYYVSPALAERGPFSSRESAVKDAWKEEERWSATRHAEVLRGMGIVGGGKRHHARAKCGNVNPHEGLTCTRHAGHEGLHIGSMKGRLVQWRTNADWFEGVELYDRGHELQKQRAWKLRQKTHTHACDDCGHSVIPGTRECPSCGSHNILSKDEIAAQAAELRKALRK